MNASSHRILPVLIVSGVVGAGVRSLMAQTEYTADGVPTAGEEEVRWHLNRARFDRNSENATRGTSYVDVPPSSGPVAPANTLTLAARHHTEDMATKNKFQHETVPGSAYYNATTQAQPWQRIQAEGYVDLISWAENLTVGSLVATPEPAFVAWWNSSEHRGNMMAAKYQEIGTGYYFSAPADFDNYWTMDLAQGALSFLTDTIFYDANANGKYNQGEGISGVRVSLKVNGADHNTYDISAAPGSFAISLSGLLGLTSEVWLTNQNGTAVTLSIPRDYRTFETITLAPAQTKPVGTFARPVTGVNFGFRNLTKSTLSITPPALTLTKAGGTVQFSWPSQTELQYLAQWSANLGSWTDFAGGYRNGTGGVMTQADAATTTRKYYRVMVKKP